jgi:hypothetical protein
MYYKQFIVVIVLRYAEKQWSNYPASIARTPKEMIMRFSNLWALALPVAGLLAFVCCRAAEPVPKAPESKGLVVHEWGTFSTFSGSDGKNLKFYPYDNDLPEFVHGYEGRLSKTGPQGGTISLETPVLYFYSERPVTASVQVEFPKGTITEWYPHAGRTAKKLSWEGIRLLSGGNVKLPNEKKESRYYAARETDATPLRVTFKEEEAQTTEQEKFLFYRGVGSFDMPLSVRAQGEDKFTVRWSGEELKDDLFMVRVQAGKVRFVSFRVDQRSKCSYEAEVRLPESDSTVEKLSEALVKRLTEKGLFEKEARAMVKTWRSAWFGEEGTRVLYLLPESFTEEMLPLKVEPKPTQQLRVLVGRHDVLTPEREKQIDTLVAELTRPTLEQDAKQRAAWQELGKLGRYQEAARNQAESRLKHRR